MQTEKVSSEDKEYKVNPSLPLVGYSIYEEEVYHRTKGSRKGIHNGTPTTIITRDHAKDYVDKRNYLEVYLDVKDNEDNLLVRLSRISGTARRIVAHVLAKKLEYGKDEIFLFNSIIAKELDLDGPNVSRAMQEIFKEKIFYRSDDKKRIWINLQLYSFGGVEALYKRFVQTVLK